MNQLHRRSAGYHNSSVSERINISQYRSMAGPMETGSEKYETVAFDRPGNQSQVTSTGHDFSTPQKVTSGQQPVNQVPISSPQMIIVEEQKTGLSLEESSSQIIKSPSP